MGGIFSSRVKQPFTLLISSALPRSPKSFPPILPRLRVRDPPLSSLSTFSLQFPIEERPNTQPGGDSLLLPLPLDGTLSLLSPLIRGLLYSSRRSFSVCSTPSVPVGDYGIPQGIGSVSDIMCDRREERDERRSRQTQRDTSLRSLSSQSFPLKKLSAQRENGERCRIFPQRELRVNTER